MRKGVLGRMQAKNLAPFRIRFPAASSFRRSPFCSASRPLCPIQHQPFPCLPLLMATSLWLSCKHTVAASVCHYFLLRCCWSRMPMQKQLSACRNCRLPCTYVLPETVRTWPFIHTYQTPGIRFTILARFCVDWEICNPSNLA